MRLFCMCWSMKEFYEKNMLKLLLEYPCINFKRMQLTTIVFVAFISR